ncbi:MAG: lanthionine synthetase LanC family protein [Cyclobacteriaceae bacterium]
MSESNIQSAHGLPAEAYRLARLMLENAEEHSTGLRWVFNTPGFDGQQNSEFSPNLADGSAGVVATLLNAYSTSGSQEFLEAGKKGVMYLLNYLAEEDAPYLGLYRGLGGIGLVCAHLTLITGDLEPSREALRLLSPRVDEFLNSPYTTNTLLNGRAGTLMVFLHLIAATGNAEAWTPAVKIAEDLLKKARLAHDGLYWRPFYPEINPLCGFAEGNAGIAWAFAELSRMSGQDAWFVPAEMALEYEISCLRNDRTPDYRKGIRTAQEHREHLALYRTGNRKFFHTPAFHSGWGYGDTGTLMAWQQIARISPSEQYAPATPENNAPDEEMQNDLLSKDLSCAIGWYRSAVVLNDARPLAQTRELGEKALKQVDTDDMRLLGGFPAALNVLFMGNAPTRVTNYFFPEPPDVKAAGAPEVSVNGLRKELLRRPFRRTLALLDRADPGIIDTYLAEQPSASAEANFFFEYITHYLENHNEEHLNPVREVFELEKEVLDLSYPSESYAYRNVREIARQEDAEHILNLTDEAVAGIKMVLSPEVRVVTTGRDWAMRWHPVDQRPVEPAELLDMEPKVSYIMIRPNANGTSVLENTLNQLSHFVCEAYRTPMTLKGAVALFKETFEIQNQSQLQQVSDMLREQTREFFNTGILLTA